MILPPRSPHGYLTDDAGSGVTVAERGRAVRICVGEAESAAVRRAAENLADDLASVCGADAVLVAHPAGARVVVGTLGRSAAVDAAVADGAVDVAALYDDDGAPRWEAFLVTVHDDVLYLVGTDRRGTIYAIYDFAEAIGVSPWRWWGKVEPRRREHVTVARGTCRADWPSVQYRGVFLNDEEELLHWALAHTDDGTIGPQTYRRVYELILRLKGNYLWPAMHVGAFNHDPENGRLADEMGVVIGTSHCDMLLRSNEHEFRPWAARQSEPVAYDYSLPGRNREKLREYWRGSVEQNRDHEVTWTVGMRGVHDSGFLTTAIDEDDTLDEEQKFRARVELLRTVIDDQRSLLGQVLETDPAAPPQLFVPYKEVLPLYDAGLRVPDDVTLVWANDNFGYIRRFPSEAERARSGGHGLYYHSSYWSNMTTSYLATSSTPLALMKSELRKAWQRGIRKLWVDNIGGLKPLELEMEFFLRSAWEAGRESRTADVREFTATWIDEKFTGGHGRAAGAIYAEYYQVNNQRKFEHLTSGVFSQTGYGDESQRRLDVLRDLFDRTNDILTALPAAQRDAFFQLFAVKIHMAYLVNGQFAHADRSALAHRQGRLAAADHHLDVSRRFDEYKRALIHYYNRTMSDGAWDGMFTPEDFPPPVMPLHPPATPALRLDDAPGLGVAVWGDDMPSRAPALTFWPHGVTDKWIDVFNTGGGELAWTIDADPWIEVSPRSGTIRTERRIAVRIPDPVRDAGRSGTVRVRRPDTGDEVTVTVTVASAPALEDGFAGAVEADGYVSLDPSRAGLPADGADSAWAVVPHLGRYGNAAVEARRTTHEHDGEPAPLEHRFHLRTAGAHLLELHRLPTLNATGTIRVGVSVDGRSPTILSSPITDEHRGDWERGIQDNVERLTVRLPRLDEGAHVLRLHVIDEDVTVSKLVIYTSDIRPTALGPDFSSCVTATPAGTTTPRMPPSDPADPRLAAVEHAAREFYRTDPALVPPPPQVYAGPGFWDGDTTFRRNQVVPQTALGPARHRTRADGGKDVVAGLGSGTVAESGGRVAIEAEYVLAQDAGAWTSPADDPHELTWTHTQAETDGRTGLAMHVVPRGLRWEDPQTAPGMHFALDVATPGRYHVWLLVKYDDRTDDACLIALDGAVQPASEQFSGGEMCTYGTRQIWLWALVSDLEITAGRHTLSVLARKSGLRIDRLYLTTGDELPPADVAWRPSPRTASTRTAPDVDPATVR
ncbi:glycosyl hydrolase 115 family protein [Myceligenerans halotolerans]